MCCSGGLYVVQEVYTDAQECCELLRGLYAVQEGYINVQEGCILFRGVICCSGGLYGCSGGLHTGRFYAVQGGYMMKKIMMFLVATNVVASQPHDHQRT